MIIDCNSHWLPENLFTDESLLTSFIAAVPREYGMYCKLTQIEGTNLRQLSFEKPKGYQVLNYAEGGYGTKERIQDMDKAKVDKTILRMPCMEEWIGLDVCKKVNDLLAQYLKQYPGRLLALAVVPPWAGKENIKELERCIKELGFSGVQMAAHYGTLYLDDEEFKPYFKVLNQLGVPVVVHHTPIAVEYRSLYKYNNFRRQFGRCQDQITAVGSELFSGMFEEFPNLRMIHSMLGGGFFAFANMLIPPKSKDSIERFAVDADKIRKYMAENIFFDISGASQWGKAQLECAVKVYGADHILYGSSYPIRHEWFVNGIETVKTLSITEEEKSLILGNNAVNLFKIKI
jgi:predicted TIM-barrel fold metal-dependent hydrolase